MRTANPVGQYCSYTTLLIYITSYYLALWSIEDMQIAAISILTDVAGGYHRSPHLLVHVAEKSVSPFKPDHQVMESVDQCLERQKEATEAIPRNLTEGSRVKTPLIGRNMARVLR